MPYGSCSGSETPHLPTIHWPEPVTKPCPTREYNPSMCPGIKKPEIIIENMTTTICFFNHQKYDSLSSCRQKAKHAHPLPRGDDQMPQQSWSQAPSSGSLGDICQSLHQAWKHIKDLTYPKHSFWCTPNTQLVWMSSLFLQLCPPFTSQCVKASHAVKSENKLQRRGRWLFQVLGEM